MPISCTRRRQWKKWSNGSSPAPTWSWRSSIARAAIGPGRNAGLGSGHHGLLRVGGGVKDSISGFTALRLIVLRQAHPRR